MDTQPGMKHYLRRQIEGNQSQNKLCLWRLKLNIYLTLGIRELANQSPGGTVTFFLLYFFSFLSLCLESPSLLFSHHPPLPPFLSLSVSLITSAHLPHILFPVFSPMSSMFFLPSSLHVSPPSPPPLFPPHPFSLSYSPFYLSVSVSWKFSHQCFFLLSRQAEDTDIYIFFF